jgi:hypothetical protein
MTFNLIPPLILRRGYQFNNYKRGIKAQSCQSVDKKLVVPYAWSQENSTSFKKTRTYPSPFGTIIALKSNDYTYLKTINQEEK